MTCRLRAHHGVFFGVATLGDRGPCRVDSFVRRLPDQDVVELRSRVLEKLVGRDGSGGDDPDKQGEISKPVVGKDVGIEDLRTCWIETDETGSCFKPGATSCWRAHTKPSLMVSRPATALVTRLSGNASTRSCSEVMVCRIGLSIGRKVRA